MDQSMEQDGKDEILAAKTQLLMLKGKFNKSRRPAIKMEQQRLKFADIVKYLGITVDEGLQFHSHVKEHTGRVKSIFVSFTALSCTNGGYSCVSLRTLYKVLFQSLITHGCEFWRAVALKRKAMTRALLGAQRQVLLKVCKAYRTVSGDACCVIVGVMPTDILIEERYSNVYQVVKRRIERTASKTNRREILDTWQARWEVSDKGRETYESFSSIRARLLVKYD